MRRRITRHVPLRGVRPASQVETGPSPEQKDIEELLVAMAPRADTGERKALGTLLKRLFGTSTGKPA